MSTISLPTTSSDAGSSNCAIYSDNSGEVIYNETNIIPKNNTFLECTLTQSEKCIITLSDKRLNKMIRKLNVARIHITPIIDIILQAATSYSEDEFMEKIRANEPVCYIPNNQYIKAFTAAQILHDVNTELLHYQQPKPAIYSMNTRNSFIVHQTIENMLNTSTLANVDTIYIDRDTMKQLLELHELVTQTINKLEKAEHIKQEALLMSCSDKPKDGQKKSPEKLVDETESDTIPEKPGCCPQFLEPITRKFTCTCGKKELPKDPKQNIKPVENMYQSSNHNDDGTATNEIVCSSGEQGCCPQFLEANKCNCEEGEIQKDFPKQQQPKIKPPQEESVSNKDSESKQDESEPLKQDVTEEEFVMVPRVSLMLPNEKQFTVSPSDTVLRGFAGTSHEKINKSSSHGSSKSKSKGKNAESPQLGRRDSIDINRKRKDSTATLEEKNKKETKSPSKNETKKIPKSENSSKKQQDEVTEQNIDDQTDEPNDKRPNKKLKEKKLNSKQDSKNKNSKKKLQESEKSITTEPNEKELSATDGTILNQNNDISDIEKKDETLKNDSNKKDKPLTSKEMLKNRKKKGKAADSEEPEESAAVDENVMKPTQSDNKTKKDNNKKQKKEKTSDKPRKGKPIAENKKDSRKTLSNSNVNQAVNTVEDYPSQPNATVMQAPSIHVQNNDIATNKQFFQTNSNYSYKATDITNNPSTFSNKASSDGTTGNKKHEKTPGAEYNYGYSAVKPYLPSPIKLSTKSGNDNNTVENDNNTNIEQQPEILFHRDVKHKYNTQIEDQTSQNQKQNKVISLEDHVNQQNTKIDDVNNQTLVQRTKNVSKDIISAIRRGMTSTTNEYQSTVKSVSPNFKDKYDNVADAKLALLQCLSELTKIRSYINDCADAELQTLEQSVNIQVMQHDKNCGMDDAPHIHCNLQGIELTLEADKDMYVTNYLGRNLVRKKDATTTTERLLIPNPINSHNSIVLVANISSPKGKKTETTSDSYLESWSDLGTEDPKFKSIPADGTRLSEPLPPTKEVPIYDTFELQHKSSLNEPPRQNHTNKAKKLDTQDSSVDIPYVVGIKSLPKMDGNVNITESMIISVDSMKEIMDTVEIYHKNESVNRAINSVNINHLLRSCTPVSCSIKTCLNDRRDLPELPLKPSLTSLPLSVTDLVVIRQNIERKSKSNNSMTDNLLPLRKSIYNRNTFEYYTNFQANFSSNREYFVPRVYLVYFFEIRRNDEGGDSDQNEKAPAKKRTHHTTTTSTTQQEDEADSEAERKWSDFKIFDYLRKEFLSLRGDGLSPKTSNAINVKTSKGIRNKKIQVCLTKTIEIPIKQKPKFLRKYKEPGKTNRATQSCLDTFATQTISYCKVQEKKRNPPISQKPRTLHIQTTTQTTPTNSLTNILLDTIYETELENSINRNVQQIYNVPGIIHTPSSLLEDIRSFSKTKAVKKELIVETNQYEINDTLKSNRLKMPRPTMSFVSGITKNVNKNIYPSLIPKRKSSYTNDGAKDKSTDESNIHKTNISTTRINKRCVNKYTRKDKKQSTSNSSSDCDDVSVRLNKCEPTSSSNLSQSKLISSSPKRQSQKNNRNIVRDKIKNLPVYHSESLSATLRQQQSFPSSEWNQYASQVTFGCGSDNSTSPASSVFNLPKKHSCGFLSVLSPTCGCPDVTVFIPCFCSERGCENIKNSSNTDSLDILTKGVSGMYHVIMPPGSNRKLHN